MPESIAAPRATEPPPPGPGAPPRTALPVASRARVALGVATSAGALLPFALSTRLGWEVLLGVGLLAVLALPARTRLVAPFAAAAAAYAGGATLAPAWGGLALLLLLAALATSPRDRLIVAVALVAVAVSVGLVASTLAATTWGAEALQLGRLATALGLAAAAGLASDSLVARASHRPWLAMSAVALTLTATAVAAVHRAAAAAPLGFPDWRTTVDELEPLRARGAVKELAAALERLQVAGVADAGVVLASLALASDAGPRALRAACPRGGRRALDASFAAAISMGERACRAATAWPERGAAMLADAPEPGLQRLRGDLLMDAGLVPAALAAYGRAASLGDPHATNAAVRALVARNRLDEARRVALPGDPLGALWLGSSLDIAAQWRAWNRLLDFDGLTPPERRGLWIAENAGDLPMVFDRDIGRRALVTRSRFATGFAVALPPTPERRVPARLVVQMKPERWARIDVVGADGTVVFECDAAPDAWTRPLPSSVCGTRWGEAVLELAGLVRPPLSAILVRGDLRLAVVRAEY